MDSGRLVLSCLRGALLIAGLRGCLAALRLGSGVHVVKGLAQDIVAAGEGILELLVYLIGDHRGVTRVVGFHACKEIKEFSLYRLREKTFRKKL